MQIALIRVAEDLAQPTVTEEENVAEPDLVVLFQRISNAGVPLSNEDYVFSLIKHRFPEAHNFVQELYAKPIISTLLSANDLVMTAVRLAANTHSHRGQPFTDIPVPSPKEFGRMLRAKVDPSDGDFLGNALMPLIMAGRPLYLLNTFEEAHRLLLYREENPDDPGFPKLAFPLLQRQLVQVLVFWIHQRQRVAANSTEKSGQAFDASRGEVLRFVLFWLLCVKDKEEAGKVSFAMLRDKEYDSFPAKEMADKLCQEELAIRLQHPDILHDTVISLATPGSQIQCRHKRFNNQLADGTFTESQPLYRRWLQQKHLLLWLQRKTLQATFPDSNPLAGRNEEAPYDYDHICPWADWGKAGYKVRKSFRDFCENSDYGIVADNIGNYRVWDSSSNRSEGDAPAPCKLRLFGMDSHERRKCQEKSAVTDVEMQGWKESSVVRVDQNVCKGYCGEKSWETCSVANGDQGHWNEVRAQAFQKVVEERAFRLFKQYFKEAGFDEWISPKSHTENSTTETIDKIV